MADGDDDDNDACARAMMTFHPCLSDDVTVASKASPLSAVTDLEHTQCFPAGFYKCMLHWIFRSLTENISDYYCFCVEHSS